MIKEKINAKKILATIKIDSAQIKIFPNNDVAGFLKIRGLTIVPCVNPDGVEIALHGSDAAMKYKPLVDKVCENTSKWQANAKGVDINHNFNAGWCELKKLELSRNINAPAPTRFGGNCPESEPETKAIARLCRQIPVDLLMSFHSQGEEIYYGSREI